MITSSPKAPLLVFAVGGRVGSGCSYVRDWLRHCLATFGYSVEIIDVTATFLSGDAEPFVDNLDVPAEPDVDESLELSDSANRVRKLQRSGNRLRQALGNEAIAALCVSDVIAPHIEEHRVLADSKRQAYIIDSLKHPAEVRFLRQVFREAFCMVGVVASDKIRMDRLRERKNYDESTFALISSIDANEGGVPFGQKSIDAVVEADYFFANDFARKDEIQTEAERFMRLIFGVEVQSPRKEEVGMYTAFNAARRSACLSRQVGAAIFDAQDDILATGHNDVPQFGGSLYDPESQRDERCFARGGKCYNDEEKDVIARTLLDSLAKAKILPATANRDDAIRAIKSSRVRDLIEFTRAVHAETDAIISVARSGKVGLVGSTLYCTTFPCHNCAKHIIDAGISRVVYLEPYEKSLARKLHGDAINAPDADRHPDKVAFDLYGGVAPSRFDEFFSARNERKQQGRFIDRDRERDTLPPIGAQEADILSSRLKFVADQIARQSERQATAAANREFDK